MVFRLLAGGERKELLPKEEPFVILKDMPPGYPSLLRPENTKNATTEGTGSPQVSFNWR